MNMEVLRAALPEMVTQLLGFLIVFFILKRYAFKPVLGMLDARRKTIEDELAAIDGKKQELDGLEKEYRRRLENIEQEMRVRIQEASKISEGLAKDVQERARLDAQKISERARADIEQEIAKARLSMRHEIVEISALLAEKILREKLDAREQERLVDKFIVELEKIG